MVFRIYVEKKMRFEHDAHFLRAEINNLLEIKGLESLRIVNRYDAENIDKKLFETAVKTVFSEPQTDHTSDTLDTAGGLCRGVSSRTVRSARRFRGAVHRAHIAEGKAARAFG